MERKKTQATTAKLKKVQTEIKKTKDKLNKFFLILFHILKTSCIYRLFQAFLFYIYPLLHHFYTIFRLATPSFKLLHFLKQSIFRHMTI